MTHGRYGAVAVLADDGGTVAVACADGTVRAHDADNGELRRVMRMERAFKAVALAPAPVLPSTVVDDDDNDPGGGGQRGQDSQDAGCCVWQGTLTLTHSCIPSRLDTRYTSPRYT